MARRLSPEARRAEIILVTQRLMSEGGYRSLSLREVARRCGMSAPGLMHYFTSMPDLLSAALDARDEADLEAVYAGRENLSLVEIVDNAMNYYDDRMAEVRQYDALELEALDPKHPAHDYFEARNARQAEMLRPLIEREFADPASVEELIFLVMTGIRMRMLHDPEGRGMTHFWGIIRPAMLALPRRG